MATQNFVFFVIFAIFVTIFVAEFIPEHISIFSLANLKETGYSMFVKFVALRLCLHSHMQAGTPRPLTGNRACAVY